MSLALAQVDTGWDTSSTSTVVSENPTMQSMESRYEQLSLCVSHSIQRQIITQDYTMASK